MDLEMIEITEMTLKVMNIIDNGLWWDMMTFREM